MVVAQQVPQHASGRWVRFVLTISKLKRWSINYYIDTAAAAERAAGDLTRAGGGLGEYYSERETRTPMWLLAGDTRTVATLVGLTDAQRAGGDADAGLVAHWLDDGIALNGAQGRAFGERGVHGFDLTFCAPKSVSLVRALRTDGVMAKAIADAHTTALSEAMETWPRTPATPGFTTRAPARKTWFACRVWRRSPISTRRRGAGTPICTPMSSSRIGRPAPPGSWCRLMGRRCIAKPKRRG
jgi:hypothetical protein